MITAHLQGALLASGEADVTISLEETLPTDEVHLHIWEPRSANPLGIVLIDDDEKEDDSHQTITLAYDEQRQQHTWRGTVPSGRNLLIVVARGGEGVGWACVEFDGARFTWFREMQVGMLLRVNQSSPEANPTMHDEAPTAAHEALTGTLYVTSGQGIALYVFGLGTQPTDRVSLLASALTSEALWKVREAEMREGDVGKAKGFYAFRDAEYWCASLLRPQEVLHLSVEREGRVIAWISVDWTKATPEIRPNRGITLAVEPLGLRSLLDLLAQQPDELDEYLHLIAMLCSQSILPDDPPSGAVSPGLLDGLFDSAMRHAARLLLERDYPFGQPAHSMPPYRGFGASFATDPGRQSAPHHKPPIVCFPELPDSAFVGRASLLDKLQADFAFAIEERWFLPQVLSGIAGAGKTRTALEYARRHREEYTHLFWADASTPERLVAAFEEFALAMGIPAAERAEPTQLIKAVWNWLQRHDRWLLVFDGAAETTAETGVSWAGGQCYEEQPHGHVLITTRSSLMHVLGAQGRRLGDLPEHEAMGLLLHRAGLIPLGTVGKPAALLIQEKLPEQECSALFALLGEIGRLPLVLDQLGAYLAETGVSPSRAYEEFARDPLTLLGRRGEHQAEHPDSALQALQPDIEALTARRPQTAALLNAWAFLGAVPLPESVLQIGGNWLLATLYPGHWGVRDWGVQQSIAYDLDGFSFLTFDRQMRTHTLHRLVSCLVQATMDAEERPLWAERAVQVVAYTLEHPDPRSASPLQAQQLRPLVQHCLRLIERAGLDSPEVSRARSVFLRLLSEQG